VTQLLSTVILQWTDAAAKDYPLRRVGESEEVAQLMAFLVSDEASFITGENIHIDGGFRRVSPRHDQLFEEIFSKASIDSKKN
jgi:NAD(P)-dependent dehydrogenase (short-subunit alcohol dehydrogenase family)